MRDHLRSGTESIDGLRGVAILLVVLYHSWLFSWLTPELAIGGAHLPIDVPPRVGYLGVDLFFTISGFVLYFPEALRAFAGAPQQAIAGFALRRFAKIAPSYLLALLATSLASAEYLRPDEIVRNFATHAVFVQNAYEDGFGRANSVFWSLAVEVQFYLIFPFVARAFRWRPVATALGLTAFALAYRAWAARCCIDVETVTRQMPAYLDLFAAGMLAAHVVVFVRHRPRLERLGPAFTALAVLFAWGGFMLMSSANAIQYVRLGPQHWDLTHRTLVALTAGGLACTSCLAVRPWRAALANPLFTWLSIVSYNVYLWHTLIMVWMWKHGVPRAATPNPHDDDHWKIVYLALGWSATLVVSTAITYFFERPIIGYVKRIPFAFAWSRVFRRAMPTARSERRT